MDTTTAAKRFKEDPNKSKNAPPSTVEYANFNLLKKKSIRGLLRKRAKKYECKYYWIYILGIADESEGSDTENPAQKRVKKQVLKTSFAQAFQSILNKHVEPKTELADGPILAKYKKPAKEVSEE